MRVADHHTYFVGGSAWGFDVWVHNAACAPGDPQPAHMYFFNLAKSNGISTRDAKWLWKNVVKQTATSEKFSEQTIGIVKAVSQMNDAGYALKRINLGYNKDYRNGIDLVFRHKTDKHYAFVEAKGSYSWLMYRYGPKPDTNIDAMQGSAKWNLDRLGRSNSYYARYLEKQFAGAEHFVSFADGKLMRWSLDNGGVLR